LVDFGGIEFHLKQDVDFRVPKKLPPTSKRYPRVGQLQTNSTVKENFIDIRLGEHDSLFLKNQACGLPGKV